ncbi:MAG: AsmA family protein [Terracidiphilus sp.]|jgi:hypothetical protein
MIEDEQPRQRQRKRLWVAVAAVTVLLAIVFVPPFVSVSHYKSRITQLISTSLGRPVHLSSVEVRLLPRPGFLLNNLTVEEDPAYGAEPVLHANSVTASIRLLSLWRGRLEIDTISVDEASLNVVRSAPGSWNIDSLLRTAASQAQSAEGSAKSGNPVKLPYLEATNSRINIKSGAEKLPFSLVDADISFWQPSPGDWRIRLRGQPARTDLTIEQADTGIVRLEAEMRRAAELREMPVHLEMEWRQAQLGQLTRLLFGSDAGWRGDLTGQLQFDGTAETAQIKTRLRAIGVHRAEFTPAEPMDFDANCALTAHFITRAVDNMVCDSPLGSGRVRLAGNWPGNLQSPVTSLHLSANLDRVPLALGLDALRTVRSGLAHGLAVSGTASGELTYAPNAGETATPDTLSSNRRGHSRGAKSTRAVQGPLTGNIAIDGLRLSGDVLSEPIRIGKLILEPAPAGVSAAPDDSQVLAATVAIPAGAASPMALSVRLGLSGYQLALHGQASIVRARELAHVAGFAQAGALDSFAGEPLALDLTAEGPWMPVPPPVLALSAGSGSSALAGPAQPSDSFAGVVSLRNVNWKTDYLANHVVISQATLRLAANELRWDPVVFSYGPLKGTASLSLPTACEAQQPCVPRFQVQFGALDAALIQTAFLGAQERTTLLSTLIEHLRPTAAAPAWPHLEGTVKAESLVLGPVTLREPKATVSTLSDRAEISAFDAGLLGGHVQGTGLFRAAPSAKDKPSYSLEGQLEKLSPQAVGQLLGLRASGDAIGGNGKIELAGFTGDDLAASAKGSFHFEWKRGTIAAVSGSSPIPSALTRFDHWSGDAEIANGALTLKDNQVRRGAHSEPVQASVTLAERPKIVFPAAKTAQAKR